MRDVQRKVVVQAIYLHQDDAETVREWFKPPKDQATEDDYLILVAFIYRIKIEVFS